MKPSPASERTERQRQQTLARREQTAAQVLGPGVAEIATRAPLSFAATTLHKALPRDLLDEGLITFDPQGQPRVAQYDPALLAPNPQRGRVLDRGLDELAASLDTCGQQEPILARLVTDTDRQRWPTAFTERQILLIVKGHRLYFAQPRSHLTSLRVELLLPEDGEDDVTYARRALRRASIKVMHSQAYDIFDKVNQYMVWRQEFSISRPKDAEVAAYFEISRTEAQRVKTVAELDPAVAQDIINAERRPADEVVFTIAARPQDEHRDAYRRFGHLTVAAVRRLEKLDGAGKAEGKVSGPGRPRNYVLGLRDDASDIAYVSTTLTPQQWKERGGAAAFLRAVQALTADPTVAERLARDLGEDGPTSGDTAKSA